MPIVYIAGDAPGVGVTAVATGIASLLGDTVTLLKAASFRSPDTDADFHRALRPYASEPTGLPVTLDSSVDLPTMAKQVSALPLPGGLAIVEGVSGSGTPSDNLRADAAFAEALDARVVLVSSPASADPARATTAFGGRLIGAVVNRVPAHGLAAAQTETSTAFENQGVPVIGLVPEDRRMLAPSVRDVAAHLGAECINNGDLDAPDVVLDALVEHFMLGGLFLDTGVYVFGKREEKAVIVRGDRPDLQMAALETSTVCLVLTEGRRPVQYIDHHAELNQVPMLLVDRPTLETMEALHSVGERATVHSAHKAKRFAELLSAHCDLTQLTATSTA